MIDKVLRATSIRRLAAGMRDRILMQPQVQGVLQHFGNDLENRKWIFVLGCYNSGTTLLAKLLQTHDRLDGLPNEGAFLSDALPYPERFGWPRMWSECADRLAVPAQDAERARRIRRQWSLWINGNPEFVVEKSISNVLRIEFLANNFREARFVHIVRNGYAVAAGIRRKANLARWKNPRRLRTYPVNLCANQWAESVRRVNASHSNSIPMITVRYEELTEQPLETMKSIFEFIGVDPITDTKAWRRMDVHESKSEIRNMNGTNISSLSVKDISVIRSVAEAELDMYGYL